MFGEDITGEDENNNHTALLESKYCTATQPITEEERCIYLKRNPGQKTKKINKKNVAPFS